MSDTLDREIILDPQGRWWCSRLNRLPEVQAGSELPPHVHIRDCTLREGEETPGTFLSVDQKIAVARLAQDIGVEELEVGYCGAIDAHFALVRRLRQEGIWARLTSINRTYTRDGEWQREIDRAAESGVDGVSLVVFCNDDLLASVPWLSKEAVPGRGEAGGGDRSGCRRHGPGRGRRNHRVGGDRLRTRGPLRRPHGAERRTRGRILS